MLMRSLTGVIFLVLLVSSSFSSLRRVIFVFSCDHADREALLLFHGNVSAAARPLNWTAAVDCCQWEGVGCRTDHLRRRRVYSVSLPGRGLSGIINPTFVLNITFLSYLNLSRNGLSGNLPLSLFRRLKTLDLSFNRLVGTGLVLRQPLLFSGNGSSFPLPIQTLDLSNNRFNGSIDPSFLRLAANLVRFNVSNNSFSGSIPSYVCDGSPFIEDLDFSDNAFTGQMGIGFGSCSRMKVFRAGFNSFSGVLPYDLYNVKTLEEISLPNNRFSGGINGSIVHLSNLRILELHVNELSGELPPDIGLLSNLEQVQLHTNRLNGTLPHSLTDCTKMKTVLIRNNLFGGEISVLDFSKLQLLQAIDFGNNSFTGNIPESLCLCRSLTAIRLAYNRFVGEVPPCVASLKSLAHLSLSDNYLSNVVGALQRLTHCDKLEVLFLSRCFNNEKMPDDDDLLHLNGFQKLQILTLGGCQLKGQIPFWISKLRKVQVLNLSFNQISGPIPTWLADMPSLFVLNLTKNFLSGHLPPEIGRLPALISDNASSDLSYLALPFLFDSLQYNRLFNLPRGLKVGFNRLSGSIPQEIGQLKLLHILDMSNNNFNASIPSQLGHLVNLERLDLSMNHLSGEIPESLVGLSFLSSFSVAHNDLEGEIPRGGQFDTFPAASFEGNPKLCGTVLLRTCPVNSGVDSAPEEEEDHIVWSNIPFGMGYLVGFFAVSLSLVFFSPWRRSDPVVVNYSFVEARSV